MAANAFFGNLRDKVRSVYNNFFYNGEEDNFPSAPAYEPPVEYSAQSPYPQQAQQYAQQSPYPQQAQQYAQQPPYPQQTQYAQQSAYGAVQQQYAQQGAYAPQQTPPQQAAHQPAAAPAMAEQPAQQPRNRRMWAHQAENNVVDFGAYQAQAAQPPQPATAPSMAEQPAPAAVASAARIINARGMGDCRSAITLLRNGDSVLIVLENVTDPAEMRRLVDTLSGACYSLTATITKVSRYGVYLLAPQSVAVYADQTTNQMNGAPARQQYRGYQQPGYAGQPQAAQAPQGYGYQQPQASYAPPAQQHEFTPRAAMPQEAAQPFYTRPAPQAAAAPSFAAQPAGYGYAPDEAVAMEQ